MKPSVAVFPRGLSASRRLRLGVCLALVALPHVFHLPLWIVALAGALLAWQIATAWYDRPLPGRAVRLLLASIIFATVLAGFGRIDGQQAGVSLLLLMLVLKLCELRSHRDALVFLSLTCFLLITQFLFSQNIVMAIYLVVGIWLITAAFVDAGSDLPAAAAFADSARLLAQALPIAALLFVLFPRLPGPLWGPPGDAGAQARTGLSEQMSPGSVAQLARSDAVALRARFNDSVPPPAARYWRGPVLWDFAAGTWRMGNADRALPRADVVATGTSRWHTDIILEPSRYDWLIALDVPLKTNRAARRTAGAMLVFADDVNGRAHYTVNSASDYRIDTHLDARTRARALRLPAAGNGRTRELAKHWRARNPTPAAVVSAALQRFQQQPFVYTLSPRPLDLENSIDRFLFDSREGFCEHYAGAFTYLMRAAGIPARVVTGYQGGEQSLLGDYWIVRDSDAHAWAEVWLKDRGWVRIDPTAAVAPARIESGVAGSLADSDALPYMARAGNDAWYRVQMLWDGVNAAWNRWFLAYGPQLQRRVLDRLGFDGWGTALIALTLGIVGMLSGISLWLAWQMRRMRDPDPIARAWQQVEIRLARIGYPRAAGEGPGSYGKRVARARPDLDDALRTLVNLYIRVCYAPAPRADSQACFIAHARAFRPRRRRRDVRPTRNYYG